MSQPTIQRCNDEQCVNGFQRVHTTVQPTRPGYCSWCWEAIKEYSLCTWCGDKYMSSLWDNHICAEDTPDPIYRVRAVMLHDTKDPEYTYTDEGFNSIDQAQQWIDEDSDLFCEGCTIDTEEDPTLEGYYFDDLEIVKVATSQFPIKVLEVI